MAQKDSLLRRALAVGNEGPTIAGFAQPARPQGQAAKFTSINQQEFVGLNFDLIDRQQAKAWVRDRAGSTTFTYLVTPNVDHIMKIHRSTDPLVAEAYRLADLTLCDSRILAALARASDLTLPIVTGSDLTRDLLENGLVGGRIAIIGGDAALHQAIAKLYPRFDWRFHQPPMGVVHDTQAQAAIVKFVEDGDADVVLFAIGAPQSEQSCALIKQAGRATGVALCVGASLEFLTGAKQRAPLFMQKSGLEWLHRLLSEPTRLWRRYLIEGPGIAFIWWRWHCLKGARPPAASGSTRSGGG